MILKVLVGLNNIYSNIKHQYSYYNVINSGFSNKIKSYLKLSPEKKYWLLMDNTSSMYLYINLNWDANRFLPVESKDCMNSALCEYRNISARRGTQFVPMGMSIFCWKTFHVKTTKMLSSRISSILMTSSSLYLPFESECSFTKFNKLHRKQNLDVLYQVCDFRASRKIINNMRLFSIFCGYTITLRGIWSICHNSINSKVTEI